jgi:hypothetical protein
MNSRVPIALAIGAGYLLGRTHKMRWALILGSAAATGRLNGLSTQVLERGTEVLRSSPELSKIAQSAGRLLDVGRQAAVSSLTSRVETMSSGLEERAQGLGAKAVGGSRKPGRVAEDEAEDYDEADEYDETDEYDDEPAESEEPDEDQEAEEPAEATSRGRGRASSRPVARRGR